MSKAVCPGSFDPITNGHLVVIERASRIFDDLVVAVSGSPSSVSKRGLFTLEERIELITEVTPHIKNIEVVSFEGLLVNLCREQGADCVVKGIRAVSDFDYEMQMAQMNARMGIETVFLPTSPEFSYLSSSLMKEVVTLGGDINGLVPPVVEVRLKEKLGT
jgi:pantetheine-phosphate adenylyltransferase